MHTTAHRLLAALAGAALALVAPACGPSSAAADQDLAAAQTGARKRELPRVRVAPVERRPMEQVLETTSKLESEAEIQVFPRVSGVVEEVRAEEGDHVEAGAILGRLDARDALLAVRDAEVMLAETKNRAELAALAVDEAAARVESTQVTAEQAQRDHDRDLKLYEGGRTASVLSEQALEARMLALSNARSDHRLAQITVSKARLEHEAAKTAASRQEVALERARLALSYTEITAPFAGVVAERRIRVGDTVGSAEPAYVLTDTDNLRAVFYRPQEELDLFRTRESDGVTRLTLTATAEAYPGETFEGGIERVSPTIDAESGQFRVTARLAPGEGRARLLPGMLVRLLIVTDRHPDALVVPKRALRREGERRYVLVADPTTGAERTLRRVEVTESFSDEEYVEVESEGELGPGTEVVVVGSRDLSPGDPVVADDGGALDAPASADEAEAAEDATDAGATADESGAE